MLAAISIGKVVFGLALVTAFSAGLAGVLTGAGMVMLYGRFFLTRFLQVGDGRAIPGRWHALVGPALTRLPVFSAAAVALLGLVIIIQTLAGGWLGR
jgi:ABC-type nickel/cobalt efflux system permease component RcnA